MKLRFKCESLKAYGERSEAILSLAEKDSKTIHSSKMRIMMECPKDENFFEPGERYFLTFEEAE